MLIAKRNSEKQSNLFFYEEELHKSPKGYFLIAYGGAATIYSRRTDPNTWSAGRWKVKLTPELAQRWLKGESFQQMVINENKNAYEAFRTAKPYRG